MFDFLLTFMKPSCKMNLSKINRSSYNRGDMVRKFLPGRRKWPDYERKCT